MTSIVRNATSLCDDDALCQSVPDLAQGEPFAYLAEKCRREFLRAWHEQNGDAIDTATEVYK